MITNCIQISQITLNLSKKPLTWFNDLLENLSLKLPYEVIFSLLPGQFNVIPLRMPIFQSNDYPLVVKLLKSNQIQTKTF